MVVAFSFQLSILVIFWCFICSHQNGASRVSCFDATFILWFQEDFYAVVDWAYKIDPLRCISMHGITERYLSGQKADAAGFVRLLLGDLESRISMQFGRVRSQLILTHYSRQYVSATMC